MSPVIALTQKRIIQSPTQTKIWQTKKITTVKIRNTVILASLVVLLVIGLSILYIIQTNSVATGGYRLKSYQEKISVLESENKNLELMLSEIGHLSSLKARSENLGMVKAENIEYISKEESGVAIQHP